MTINFNSYNEGRKMCKEFADNELFSSEVRMMASINYTLLTLGEELNSINKNLEKIANKYFLQVGDLKTTVNNVGSFIPNREINAKDIVYNLNKDSYVDKNIISD